MSDAPHHLVSAEGARVAPGWYPDPSGAPAERWWDGAAWTAHTRAHPVLAQPLGQGAPRPAAPRNTQATVGLVLGALALLANTFLLVSLAGLVLSVLGLGRAGQLVSAGYGPVGRRRAILGIVLSVLGGAGTVLFKALLF